MKEDEKVKSLINKRELLTRRIIWISASVLSTLILLFASIAFFTVGNFNVANVGILIVLMFVAGYSNYKMIIMFFPDVLEIKANIVEVNDITATFESIHPELKGEKTKIEVIYDFGFAGQKVKSSIIMLFDRYKFEELKKHMPMENTNLTIYYDKEKHEIVDADLPLLRPFIQEF